MAAVARALVDSFPHVNAYDSVEEWGIHFLVSMDPLPDVDASHVPQPMPAAAQRDLVEWEEDPPAKVMDTVLTKKEDMGQYLKLAPGTPPIQDDRPINEYFLLRRTGEQWLWSRART